VKFLFVGVNFRSADREVISTDIDKFLKLLKNNREYRENNCKIPPLYTQFKIDDFSIEPTTVSVYVGKNTALSYLVYYKDKIVGYTNIDFLYTGLKFKTSNIRSQRVLHELEFFFEENPTFQYFRKLRQVSVAEWFDHILKADPVQISEHYSLRLKGSNQVRFNPIETDAKKIAYEWTVENNRSELGEDVLEVLELLNTITHATVVDNF